MTDATFMPDDVAPFDHGRLSQRHSTWTIAGAGAVTLGVLVGSWLIDRHAAPAQPFGLAPGAARLTAAFRTPPAPALPDLARSPGPRPVAEAVARPSESVAALPAPAASLIDPGFAGGPPAPVLADSAPVPSRFAAASVGAVEKPQPGPVVAVAPEAGPSFAMILPLPGAHDEAPAPAQAALPSTASPAVQTAAAEASPQAEAVPLPTPRPAFPWAAPEQYRPPARRATGRNTDTAPTPQAPRAPGAPVQTASAAPADDRGFLEKFFGGFRPSGSALGYASPEDGLFGRAGLPGGPATPRDRFTAVYDISAHTVYMPDGSKLEAHSGLGGMMDDPRHVTARNTGPTPPHLYDLTMRESLFHGVQALRLNPVGGGGVYGRDGLLAHTYMLGPNGQSNGCVSFRDYQAFLRAYQNGQVKRLVVVAGGM